MLNSAQCFLILLNLANFTLNIHSLLHHVLQYSQYLTYLLSYPKSRDILASKNWVDIRGGGLIVAIFLDS